MNTIKHIAAVAAGTACLATATLSLGVASASAHQGGDDRTAARLAARGSDEVIRQGSCSGSADWKLKVKTDDGRLEVEAEVDSNVNGQSWPWVLRHNGSVSARGTGTTTGPSGSFTVDRRMVNLSGTDRIVFRATHGAQVCRGVVNF